MRLQVKDGWLVFFTLILALMLGIGFMPAAHAKVHASSSSKSASARSAHQVSHKVHKVKYSKSSPGFIKTVKSSKRSKARAHRVAFDTTDWNPRDLTLRSGAVLVYDQETNQPLYGRNDQAVMPIASITKLMNAMVMLDAGQSMEDRLVIDESDVDYLRHSTSRLRVGTSLTRAEMLHLALMSSENRAANALARYYPGGIPQFVAQMNRKAQELQMYNTHFADPTGLDSRNVSTAQDLIKLVQSAQNYPAIRTYTTSSDHWVTLGHNTMQFRNSNRLVRNPNWDIGLSKTGYISDAGRCLVMQATIAGKQLIMVLLDGAGKEIRTGDAIKIKRWLESGDSRIQRLG